MEDWYKEFYSHRYKEHNLDLSKAIDPAGYELFVHNKDIEKFIHGCRSYRIFGRNNILTPIYTKQKLKYNEIYFRINPEKLTLVKGDDGKFYTLDTIKSENILQGYSLENSEGYLNRYEKDIKTYKRNLEIIENRDFFRSIKEMFNAKIYEYFDKSIFTIEIPECTKYVSDSFQVYCAICGYDIDSDWDKFCIKKHKVKDITKKVKGDKDVRFLISNYEIDNKNLKLPDVQCLTFYPKEYKQIRSFFNFKDTNKLFLFYGNGDKYIEAYKHLIPMSNRLNKVNWRTISEYFDYNVIKNINLKDYKGKIYSTGLEGVAYIEGEITEWWIV